jgi:hypothetical protein
MMGMIVKSITTAMKVDPEEMLITVSVQRRGMHADNNLCRGGRTVNRVNF